jgi:molybdate transport system ATP-binding protein
MTITVDVEHRLGAFRLDTSFESAGPLTALFGPSGSGKTSLINLIAGLIHPDAGRIEVGGRVLVDTGTGTFVPKHRRRIGYVFQDARLFPHLTVRQNLNYGRFFTPRVDRHADFAAVVELLGIGHLLERRPGQLSGGEKQRVAIGRALVASPKLILMDEPLASLDDARKAEIMPYIERLRDETGTPIVYVSHSVAEVARLATDVVVLKDGKVADHGRTSDVLQQPGNLPRAERGEAGAVLVTTVEAHDDAYDMTLLRSAAGIIRVPRLPVRTGTGVRLHIRARDVLVATERQRGLSALNVLAGTVSAIGSRSGPLVEVRIDCNGEAILSRITRQSLDALGLQPGKAVFAVVKSVAFDQDGGPTGASFEGE